MRSRRNFLKRSALATSALLTPKTFMFFNQKEAFFPSIQNNSNSVTLLHTNDLHNHLEPHTHDIYTNIGGLKKAAGIVSEIKNANNNVLLVDAGDMFCGNMKYQNEYATALQLMRSAGYDAALLGNHDYEAGEDCLLENWYKKEIPLVASNYLYKDIRLKNLHEPYKVVQKGNIKIGIVGAGIELKGLVPTGISDNITYIDPLKELTAIATMLKREKKCQLVICLSHLGYRNKNTIDDLTLAACSKDIDIIIGGHSHTFMQAPQIVLNKQQEEVIINHGGYGGMVVGNMNISFDDSGNKNLVTFNNLLVGTKDNAWSIKV